MLTTMVLLLTTETTAALSSVVSCCHAASLTSRPISTGYMEPNSMAASPMEADAASDPAMALLPSDLKDKCVHDEDKVSISFSDDFESVGVPKAHFYLLHCALMSQRC